MLLGCKTITNDFNSLFTDLYIQCNPKVASLW